MSLIFEIELDTKQIIKLSAKEAEELYLELDKVFGHYKRITHPYELPNPYPTTICSTAVGDSLMNYEYSEEI